MMENVLAALATKALYSPVIPLVAKLSFTKQPWIDAVEQVPRQKQVVNFICGDFKSDAGDESLLRLQWVVFLHKYCE